MKKGLIVLLITVALLGGCTRADETPATTNPVDIVKAVIEASNSDDIEKYLSLLADDFTFIQNPPGTRIEGKAQYGENLKALAAWKHYNTVTSDYEIDGDKVSCTLRETGDDLRIMGLSEVNAGCEYQVRDGKILSLKVTVDSEDWDKIIEYSSGGIGINIKFNDEGAVVEKLAENSPAAEAGIKPGDIITAVDGVSYSQMREGELALRIRGKIGSKVQLSLKRGDSAKATDIEVTRADMSQLRFPDSQPSSEPNDETPTPSQSERVEPDPSGQTGQSDELDILNDILGIYYLADGYNARQVLPVTFGLCAQIALLPNGDVALCNHAHSISILSNGTVRPLVASRGIMTGVTALPDGRICYGKNDQIIAIHPGDGTTELFGTIPTGEGASALATDKVGRVYATTHNKNLYRFIGSGSPAETLAYLPFESSPTDIDIAENGDIYVVGPRLFVRVKPDGQRTILANDLQNDPVWCEIAPDGKIYIKDLFSGIRLFDPNTGKLSPVVLNIITGTSDFLAPSSDELLLVPFGSDIIIRYNLADGTGHSIATNAVNSEAIAASRDGAVYLATPSVPGVNKSYFIRVYPDGIREELTKFTFNKISSADVDQENRLCFYADDKFHRVEKDGSLTSFFPNLPADSHIDGTTRMAVGPDGSWYCITVNPEVCIQVWKTDTSGKVIILPISFDLTFFNSAYRLTDSRIDVSEDGKLAFIVSAIGSKGQGPCYQRVYRSETDGSNLTLIGSFDSSRIGVMVDIAIGSNNEVIALTCQKDGDRFCEMVYLIDNDGNISEFLQMRTGRDPKGMDMDINDNVWLGTTVGLFYISH